LCDCEEACEGTDGCESVAFCGNTCYLKSKVIQKNAAFTYNEHCTTYYKAMPSVAQEATSSQLILSRPRFRPGVVPGDGDDQANNGGEGGDGSEDGAAGCGTSTWVPLGGAAHNVADDEGRSVGEPIYGTLCDCEEACEGTDGCESLAFCGNACYLKSKVIQKSATFSFNEHCTTYYKGS